MTDWGKEAAARLEAIAAISEPGPGVTRLPYTQEHRRALELLESWMLEAGLSVTLDAAGTLVGRLDGPEGAGTFYLGSHQDSVRHGGAFDGIMGVVLSILSLEKLRAEGGTLPFSVEVLAFADEEGVRFPTALLGSRALAGTADTAVLDMADAEGTTLRDALRAFGCDPDELGMLARPRAGALGFLETHIEQGPVLETQGQALAAVSAICGIERHAVTLTGATGHAGTLPMEGRRDALVGAAALVTEVNRLGRETSDLRATVGVLDVSPNVVNAVPGHVRMTAEFRSPRDKVREAAGQTLQRFAVQEAERIGLDVAVERTYAQPAQPCDAALTEVLLGAIQEGGGAGCLLPSGATHDASAMADLCPIVMLFVRCRNGVSHVPEEHVDPADLGRAVGTLSAFLRRLQPAGPSRPASS